MALQPSQAVNEKRHAYRRSAPCILSAVSDQQGYTSQRCLAERHTCTRTPGCQDTRPAGSHCQGQLGRYSLDMGLRGRGSGM